MAYKDYKTISDTVTNAEAINQSIRNILLTKIGSVPGKPRFGSNIFDILFEPINFITIDILKRSIVSSLSNWEPRILVQSVEIEDVPEYNKLICNITYNYQNLSQTLTENVSVLLKG